ncbi:MAG TPA: hypothetical protein VIL99_05520 [Ignavibacteria bacterium]
MKNINVNSDSFVKQVFSETIQTLHKYSEYSLGGDFYSFQIEKNEKNPKDISKIKFSNENDRKRNEKKFNADVPNNDLEDSGSKLDN